MVTAYVVVGPLRDKYVALRGKKVSVKGVIKYGMIELTEIKEAQ